MLKCVFTLLFITTKEMYDFMEYCLKRFYRASGWNVENQYANLCSWSRAILDFQTPSGCSLVISGLPTPQFKPTYTLNALPTLNGSLGYLYTSKDLDIGKSATVDYQEMIDRFRIIVHPPKKTEKQEQIQPDYLLYGRMFFPGARLEAMYVRRLSDHLQYLITAVNSLRSPSPHVAMQLQYDKGKWCSECSYTSDDGLLGARALYNIGYSNTTPYTGQWSIGTELYYGVLDKSGGLSTGVRYHAPSTPTSPPFSFTYTLNPIVGHMSTSYVAQVSNELILCSRFDFSIYSYESDLVFGFEYKTKESNALVTEVDIDDSTLTVVEKDAGDHTEKLEGLIKAKWGFTNGLSLMWEGRLKNALFSFGLTADLRSTNPIRSVGMEVQYFS